MFQRQTALEGQRRALVAGPFEVEHLRGLRAFLTDQVKRDLPRFFQRDLGFSLSRDVFVNRDLAAVVHEAVHDADRSSVGNLENRVHLAALDGLAGEICIDVAGEGAVRGA